MRNLLVLSAFPIVFAAGLAVGTLRYGHAGSVAPAVERVATVDEARACDADAIEGCEADDGVPADALQR